METWSVSATRELWWARACLRDLSQAWPGCFSKQGPVFSSGKWRMAHGAPSLQPAERPDSFLGACIRNGIGGLPSTRRSSSGRVGVLPKWSQTPHPNHASLAASRAAPNQRSSAEACTPGSATLPYNYTNEQVALYSPHMKKPRSVPSENSGLSCHIQLQWRRRRPILATSILMVSRRQLYTVALCTHEKKSNNQAWEVSAISDIMNRRNTARVTGLQTDSNPSFQHCLRTLALPSSKLPTHFPCPHRSRQP